MHLCDSHYITDASKYVSVLLLSLRVMLHLELPHINVLSKIDLLASYGELGTCSAMFKGLRLIAFADFNLDFYTEVLDLSHLENILSTASPRFTALNMAICTLVEEFSLVGFETLAVEDKESMAHLTHAIDRATGYIYVPPSSGAPPGAIDPQGLGRSQRPNEFALFSTSAGPLLGPRSNVRDVQERWIDDREEFDAFERREWRKEGETIRDQRAREDAAKKSNSK